MRVFILISVALILLLSGCKATEQMSPRQLEKYTQKWSITDSIKVALPLYEIVDSAICEALDFIIISHMSKRKIPSAIIYILPVVIKGDSVHYVMSCFDFLSLSALERSYGSNTKSYFEKIKGCFRYKSTFVFIRQPSIHPKNGKSYEEAIDNVFKNTGKEVDFYPQFGRGEVRSSYTFLYENEKFILIDQYNGSVVFR